jgi:hypothetical protein
MPVDLSSLSDEQLQTYKSLLAKKQVESNPNYQKNQEYLKVNAPPQDAGFWTTLGKDISNIPSSLMATGTGEKGDERPLGIIPAMGRASHEQFQQGKEDINKGEYLSGAGHYLAGAIPGVGPLAATAGDELGSGQYGQGGAHAVEALAPFLFKGALETPIGKRVSSAAKVAAPDLAKGFGKAGAGMATGAGMKALGVPGSDFSTALLTRPGLRQMGQGLVAGAKELVNYGKKPQEIVAPPGKGPSINQLKTAATKGIITPEQFDASIDKMNDLAPETKELHKAEVRTSLAEKNTKSPGVEETPKTLSVGQLERLVKIGRIEPEEFHSRLITELKYKPQDAEHLTELLKKSIEDEEDEEEEITKKPEGKSEKKSLKVEPIKSKTPEVKGSLSDEELQNKINSHLEVKSPLESQVIEPNLTAPKELQGGGFIPSQRPGQGLIVDAPDAVKTYTVDPPPKSPITERQIEESQSDARLAKESTLAKHLLKNKIDLEKIPRTYEYLKAISDEAGLKRVASLRTLENAIIKARELNQLNKP